MPLMLSVEVLELSGTLAINIPPPPTDRIWYQDSLLYLACHFKPLLSRYSLQASLFFFSLRYSFRVPPRLDLHVRPMLGEREVTFTHVTEWIEKKLQCEFQVGPALLLFVHISQRRHADNCANHSMCFVVLCLSTESVCHAQHG